VSEVELFFDPMCPFCWQTSKWLRQVQRLSDLEVGYRFISLQMVNEDQPPDGVLAAVQAQGTRLLRVAAAVRDAHGNDAVGAFYLEAGQAVFEVDPPEPGGFKAILRHQARGVDVPSVLRRAGLPGTLGEAADDPRFDVVLRAESGDALARAGDDVGTPIMSFAPPDGPAFFGPVISELPSDEDAVALFEAVRRLASWPGFAELKRNLRAFPDVRIGRDLRPVSATAD
jgi:hypothetical protein